jgi:hypothetical protein
MNDAVAAAREDDIIPCKQNVEQVVHVVVLVCSWP